MNTTKHETGFTLLEVLVAMFLTTVALLAAAPLFIQASHANDVGGDMGTVGSLAVDRMERLRQERFRDLIPGGSLEQNIDGYFDDSNPDFFIRWQIIDNGSPTRTKTVHVRAVGRLEQIGPRRQVELTSVRGL
jgi:prepilin-type N-terminal cleavage/methylation domain-containing protein